MANIKSQIKRNRQNVKRNLANRKVRSEIHTRTKAAEAAIADGADNAEELVRSAITRIDKAAAGGIMHKNKAARKKSQLAKRLNAAG